MTSPSRSFNFPPTGGYVNPAIVDDSNNGIETSQPRRSSSLLPAFVRNIGSKRSNKNSLIPNAEIPLEVIPKADFYRNDNTFNKKSKRPDLEDLHSPQSRKDNVEENPNSDRIDNSANKLGWVDGVYIRTMMNLFGVMLFLRMGWMAGQAGVILALVQIIISTIVTVVTTTSMIALCTNGDIGGGGIYSMISRSVGHEAGGVIGFLFTFTNAAFVGLNLLGTAESVSDILNAFGIGICQIPSATNDQRIIGYVALIIIAVIPIISLEFEAKTMMFFFLTLVVSLTDYFIGALIPPTQYQMGRGLAYWHNYVIVPNLFPRWDGYNFFGVFGVFFPSVTGIFTGASMSADLKDPAKAIPMGTFLAIATTSTTYAVIVIFTGFTIVAYATGNPSDIIYNNITCEASNGCPYGLINDYQTMSMSGALSHTGIKIEPLIYAGIFAATLSSALGCYTAAPRIFQAFCDDHLVPYIGWFGKGYGPARDPRHGYLVTFLIAAIFIAIGDVNTAGVWISNFYLGAFFMVNLSLFHVAWINSISFRPSFKYYDKWISLIIGIFCIILMFLFDYVSASVVCGLTIIIYIAMLFVDPSKANWGPSTETQCFNCARFITFRLNDQEDHVKQYRPMILLLSGNPKSRLALVDMANRITKKYGLLFLSHITEGPIPYKTRENVMMAQKAWLKSEKINAFYKLVEAQSLSDGIRNIMQASGVGKFTPNIVMMGYKNNWQTCASSELLDYYDIIHNVLDCHFSLILFRVKEGLDFSEYFVPNFDNLYYAGNPQEINLTGSNVYSISKVVDSQYNKSDLNGNALKPELSLNVYEVANSFKYKQKKGNIDVWWLYEDGGLSLLIPYILKNNKLWRGCKLRIFTISHNSEDINSVRMSLTELLRKFRIPYSDVYVLSDKDGEPKEETKNKFVELITRSAGDRSPGIELLIEKSQNELLLFKDKTLKYLRLRELLVEHSSEATLIAMTLPIPQKHNCSAVLYMSWLELLTHDMPPFLLIRGNQTSVLTFYC